MCHFRAQNGSFVLKKFFLIQTIIITFIYLLAFFIVQNFKKILTADPELWGCTIFMVYFYGPKETPFWKIINTTLISLLAPFTVQNFKKNSSSASRVMRKRNFWAQNGPFPQMIIFSENLFISLVSFVHAYPHAKNQSQILIY